jgi:hypothetical protein
MLYYINTEIFTKKTLLQKKFTTLQLFKLAHEN